MATVRERERVEAMVAELEKLPAPAPAEARALAKLRDLALELAASEVVAAVGAVIDSRAPAP